jgi:hypothetical protein
MRHIIPSLAKGALVAAVVAAAGMGSAHATLGSATIASFSPTTVNTTDLSTATSVTLGAPDGGSGSGNLSGISGLYTLSTQTLPVYSVGSGWHALVSDFTVSNNGYNFTFDQIQTHQQSSTGAGVQQQSDLTLYLSGNVTGPGLNNTASGQLGFTQSGGPGQQISFSGTFANPNSLVPEPATMAVLGIGMLGLSFARRRTS